MQQRVFRLDIESRKWTECTEKRYGAGAPEYIPRIVVVSEQNDTLLSIRQKVWCETHQRYEEVDGWQGDTLTTTAGCRMWGFAVEIMHLEENIMKASWYLSKSATICWRVSQSEDGTVFVSRICGRISMLQCRDALRAEFVEIPQWEIEPSESVSLRFFPNQIVPKTSGISIPPIVADAALAYLLDATEKHYGKRPRLPACVHSGSFANGMTRLLAFCYYPFHMALWYYKDYFADRRKTKALPAEMKKVLPDDEENIFPYLCEGFNLQPTETLRKCFEQNPVSLAMTDLLRILGITAPFLVEKFMDKETLFGESPVYILRHELYQHLFSSHRTGTFPSDVFENDETARSFLKGVAATLHGLYEMLFYCRWRLFREGEERLASHLLDMDDHWTPRFLDAAKLFCHNYSDLPATLRDDLLREGLTVEMHNRMIRIYNEKAIGAPDFSYSAEEKRYECRMGKYVFRLIESNTDFRAAMTAAEICGGCHCLDQPDNGVLRVAMYRKGKIIAIILLSGVAKLIYDFHDDINHELLEAELQIAFLRWMHWTGLYKKHGLFYEEDYPYLTGEVHAEPLERKPRTLYEMLRVPEEEIRRGYYLRLYGMLREAGLKIFVTTPRQAFPEENEKAGRIFPPPKHVHDSEMEYLMRVFPYGERIYKAAFAGVREAQEVLSLCYENGFYTPLLPKDADRACYWANAHRN